MHTKAYRQQTWTILLLFVGHCFCAVSITQSNTNTDKGNSLNLTATTEEAGVTWTYDGGVHLTACLISQQLCFPNLKDNMKFTADNSTNTSTIAIQSLNCSLNSETYVATTTLDTASVTIKVTTPISSISSTTNLTTAKVSSQELSVEVDCVNLKNSISANYSVSRSGKPVDILIPDSIQPITFDAACNCIEKTHVITKIITALQYPNEVVEVQANVGRLALSIGKVNFTAGTDTTMEITTTSTTDESTTSQNPSTSILGLRAAETSGNMDIVFSTSLYVSGSTVSITKDYVTYGENIGGDHIYLFLIIAICSVCGVIIIFSIGVIICYCYGGKTYDKTEKYDGQCENIIQHNKDTHNTRKDGIHINRNRTGDKIKTFDSQKNAHQSGKKMRDNRGISEIENEFYLHVGQRSKTQYDFRWSEEVDTHGNERLADISERDSSHKIVTVPNKNQRLQNDSIFFELSQYPSMELVDQSAHDCNYLSTNQQNESFWYGQHDGDRRKHS